MCSHVISRQQPSEQLLHCNHIGLSRLASLFLLSLLFITKELGCCSTKHLRPCFICSEVNSLLRCCSLSTSRVCVETTPDRRSVTPPSLGKLEVMLYLPKHCREWDCFKKKHVYSTHILQNTPVYLNLFLFRIRIRVSIQILMFT